MIALPILDMGYLFGPKTNSSYAHPTPHTPHRGRRGLVAGVGTLSILSVSLLLSCSKESPSGPVQGQAANVDQLVRTFVNEARNGSAKSLETMSVDSAVWYVEAGLNYSLVKAWVEHNTEAVDSLTITVPLTQGVVDNTAAYETFNTLFEQLAGVEQEGVQHLALADVSATTTGDELVFTTRYTIGSGYEKVLDTSYPAWISLNWWTASGSCNCGVGSASVCAEKKIQTRVRSAIAIPMQPGEYFTNVETWSVHPGNSTSIPGKTYDLDDFYNPQSIPGHSNQDYPIYLCSGGDCSPCLDASDLNFHTQGTYDVMMFIRSNHCPTKQAITLTVDGDLAFTSDGSTAFHYCNYAFGVKTFPSE